MKKIGCKLKTISAALLLLLLAIGLTSILLVSNIPVVYATDDEGEEKPGGTPVIVTDFKMDADQKEMQVGGSLYLTVTVLPEGADCSEIVWTSSDEAVATVDQEGRVIAVAEGSAMITATAGDFSDTCDITVLSAPIVSVELSNKEATLARNDTLRLTVMVLPEGVDCPEIVWTSSDEAVAAVDQEGQVTAVAEGSATITATAGDFSGTCDIMVASVSIISVELSSNEATLARNDTLALDATVAAGEPIELKWESSAPDIATVDQEGNVMALGTGVATISVSAGPVSDMCAVTVVPSEIQTEQYLIDRDNRLLTGVALNTTVDEFKSSLNNEAGYIRVYDQEGSEQTKGNVGTGMDIRLVVNESVKDELEIAIVGDVNGDGCTGVYEYTLVRLHMLGASRVSAIEMALLDINGDARLSITDYILMRLAILGLNTGGDDLANLPDLLPLLNASVLGCNATLTWGSVPNADGYELYRSNSQSGSYQLIGSVGSNELSYIDNTLAMESSYYYKLLAYRTLNGVRVDTQYSAVKSVSTPDYTVYYQGDPKWGFSSSVRKSACVITAYAVTINNMGTRCTPPDIYKSNGNQTSMKIDNLKKNFGVKPVSGLGSSSKYLSSFDGAYTFIKSPSSNYEAAVKEALARNPEGVILYFKKGSDAHAVVACKLSDGKIYYSDPGRNRTTLVDFSETWCKVGHNMSYTNLAYMIALDRS